MDTIDRESQSSPDMPQHPLNVWMQLRDLRQEETMQILEISEESEVEAGYEGLERLSRVANLQRHPGYFYFRDGKLVMLYVGTLPAELVRDFTNDRLHELLGEPDLKLRSRAGKHNLMYVYPEQGIAYSAGFDGSIDFIEIFQPTTARHYEKEIYREPRFRK